MLLHKGTVKTYQIEMTMPDKSKKTINICAESKNQALCIYDDMCRNDMNLPGIIIPDNISVIYDTEDAKKYGNAYTKNKKPEVL